MPIDLRILRTIDDFIEETEDGFKFIKEVNSDYIGKTKKDMSKHINRTNYPRHISYEKDDGYKLICPNPASIEVFVSETIYGPAHHDEYMETRENLMNLFEGDNIVVIYDSCNCD